MADRPITTVTGVLVAYTHKPYELTDQATGEIRKGTSHRAYIAAEDGSRIDEIKVPDARSNLLDGAPMGTPVTAECEIIARVAAGGRYATTELSLAGVSELVG